MNPDNDFKCSNRWFLLFERRPTHTAQKSLESLRSLVQNLQHHLGKVAISKEKELPSTQKKGLLGPWRLSGIANMDQTPSELCFNTEDVTYNTTGLMNVWCWTRKNGHGKRQGTLQLTVFTDDINRVKPLIIFKGKSWRISSKERNGYDTLVSVQFQENTWCSEEVMLDSSRDEEIHIEGLENYKLCENDDSEDVQFEIIRSTASTHGVTH